MNYCATENCGEAHSTHRPAFYWGLQRFGQVSESRNYYIAIVLKAREMGIAGATMLRGLMGFGAASRIHTAKILRLSEDLPIIIEIVDSADKIDLLLPVIDEMVGEGLVTLEKVRILQYRHGSKKS